VPVVVVAPVGVVVVPVVGAVVVCVVVVEVADVGVVVTDVVAGVTFGRAFNILFTLLFIHVKVALSKDVAPFKPWTVIFSFPCSVVSQLLRA
jgi:hypothetical protein